MKLDQIREIARKASTDLAQQAEAEGTDMEVAGAIIDTLVHAVKSIEKRAMEGMRIRVRDSSGQNEIGLGTLVDHVTVYAIRSADGSLRSQRLAEEPFEGAIPLGENPKIEMDDGSVRYGCQVWWEPVKQ